MNLQPSESHFHDYLVLCLDLKPVEFLLMGAALNYLWMRFLHSLSGLLICISQAVYIYSVLFKVFIGPFYWRAIWNEPLMMHILTFHLLICFYDAIFAAVGFCAFQHRDYCSYNTTQCVCSTSQNFTFQSPCPKNLTVSISQMIIYGRGGNRKSRRKWKQL